MTKGPLRVWIGPRPEVDVHDRLQRLSLNPIVRAHLDQRHDDDWRAERYGGVLANFTLVGPADAEVAMLPPVLERCPRDHARSFVADAERRCLRTVIFASNDLEPAMWSRSIILLHPGPTRGAQPLADAVAVPYFFEDRVGGVTERPDAARPSVAFCGQGASRGGAATVQALARIGQRLWNKAKPEVVPPLAGGHVRLRAAALEHLHQHPGIDDHFLIRDQYRAGARTEEERAATQEEFNANLRNATYALCVRGTGNFSARFYEALSFGRIPLFVDTGCILPFESEIDWRSRTVWLDAGSVETIGDRLVAAHPAAMVDPVRSAGALRALWEERLTPNGFFRHLVPILRSHL